MSLATLPLTTKALVGLSLALLLSLGGNVALVRSIWVAEGKAQGAKEREALASQNAALSTTLAVNGALADQAKKDNAGLLADLAAIAERGREVRVIYRKAAASAPLAANCAPGQARVDAVNAALGAPVKENQK